MINPILLHLYDITQLISYSAKWSDHWLERRDYSEMADIESYKGEEFDAIVHLVSIEQMNRLDQVGCMCKCIIVNIIDY